MLLNDNDNPEYDRTVEYTVDDNGLLTDVIDAGKREWSYNYEEQIKMGYLHPIPYNLMNAIKTLERYEFYTLLEDFYEQQSYTHPVYLLNELRGPGKGIIHVDYTNIGIADMSYIGRYINGAIHKISELKNKMPMIKQGYGKEAKSKSIIRVDGGDGQRSRQGMAG